MENRNMSANSFGDTTINLVGEPYKTENQIVCTFRTRNLITFRKLSPINQSRKERMTSWINS